MISHVLLIVKAWSTIALLSFSRVSQLLYHAKKNHSKKSQNCQLSEWTVIFLKMHKLRLFCELVVGNSMVFPIWLYLDFSRHAEAAFLSKLNCLEDSDWRLIPAS